jgi:membrane protein DedA with SNARE-associated domain
MFEAIISFLQIHIIPLGALGVFLASVIEEVIAPIPSSVVLLMSGFLFLTNTLGSEFWGALVFKIFIPASVGMTLGSLFIYGLAYWLGRPFITRYGKWFGVEWQEVENVEKKFAEGPKDGIFIFVARAIPIIPSVVISAFAGVLRIPFRTYVVSSLLGIMVRVLVLALIGSQFGNLYLHYAELINQYENFVLIACIVLLAAFILYRKYRTKV